MSHLERLEIVEFSDADRLLLRSERLSGAAASATDGATSVTIDGVRDVSLFAEAFSGWQQEVVNITVSDVKTCSVANQAFSADSNLRQIVLENISNLDMNSGSFAAVIGDLELRNVSSSYTCLQDTFSGEIDRLSLDTVTLDRIAPGCFRSSYPWRSLNIRSSRLGAVPQRAFTGEIQEVRIEDTELSNVSPGGLVLNVSSFTMEGCVVSSLAGHALRVAAEDSITLSMLNISKLDTEAFRGLWSASSSGRSVSVSHLAVTEAADGALSMSSWSFSVLSNILISEPCQCGAVARRAARLALGPGRSLTNLTEPELSAARQVAAAVRCRYEADTPLLADFYCRRCGRSWDEEEELSPGVALSLVWCPVMRPSSGGRWLLWPFVFMLALLVLMAGCGPLLIARRCRRPADWRRAEKLTAGLESGRREPGPDGSVSTQPGGGISTQPGGGVDVPQETESTLKPARPRHLSWRVAGELEPDYDDVVPQTVAGKLEPDYDDVVPQTQPATGKACSQRARHVSWRVVGELEPEEWSQEPGAWSQEPEYRDLGTAGQLSTDSDLTESWTPGRLLPLDEPGPDYAEVLPSGGEEVLPSVDGGDERPLTGSDHSGVFQSLKSIPEPVGEDQTELMLTPETAAIPRHQTELSRGRSEDSARSCVENRDPVHNPQTGPDDGVGTRGPLDPDGPDTGPRHRTNRHPADPGSPEATPRHGSSRDPADPEARRRALSARPVVLSVVEKAGSPTYSRAEDQGSIPRSDPTSPATTIVRAVAVDDQETRRMAEQVIGANPQSSASTSSRKCETEYPTDRSEYPTEYPTDYPLYDVIGARDHGEGKQGRADGLIDNELYGTLD